MTETPKHTKADKENPKLYKKKRGRHYSEQTGHRKRGRFAKVKELNR